jgi:DNA-binding NarL/FixJ family response regulator
MKICIVDHRTLIREAISGVLRKIKTIEIAEEAADLNELERTNVISKCGAILIGEIEKTELKASIIARVKKKYPEVKVLVMTERPDSGGILEYFMAGADGYILLSWSLPEVEKAFEHLKRDGVLIPKKIGINLVKEIRARNSSQSPAPQFSQMETKILKLLCDGKMNKDIAFAIGKTEKSIKNYLRIVYLKLGVKSKGEAIARLHTSLQHLINTDN